MRSRPGLCFRATCYCAIVHDLHPWHDGGKGVNQVESQTALKDMGTPATTKKKPTRPNMSPSQTQPGPQRNNRVSYHGLRSSQLCFLPPRTFLQSSKLRQRHAESFSHATHTSPMRPLLSDFLIHRPPHLSSSFASSSPTLSMFFFFPFRRR